MGGPAAWVASRRARSARPRHGIEGPHARHPLLDRAAQCLQGRIPGRRLDHQIQHARVEALGELGE